MALVRAAEGGDMQALKELGDRLDGKPKQESEVTQNIKITARVSEQPMDPERWLEQAKADPTTYQ